MSAQLMAPGIGPLILQFPLGRQQMADHDFYLFCRINPAWRIERTREGDLVIMPPAGGGSSKRNASLILAFGMWAEADGTGVTFDSSGGFVLPNGATRSPDLAWVERSRWESLSAKSQEEFPPPLPRFRGGTPLSHGSTHRSADQDGRIHRQRRPTRLAHRSRRAEGLCVSTRGRGCLPGKPTAGCRRTAALRLRPRPGSRLVVRCAHPADRFEPVGERGGRCPVVGAADRAAASASLGAMRWPPASWSGCCRG